MEQEQVTPNQSVVPSAVPTSVGDTGVITTPDEKPFPYWLRKNRYYYEHEARFYRAYVSKHASILHVNCKNGYLLEQLEPSYAVGVDSSASCIEQARTHYSDFSFVWGQLADVHMNHQFDYIILSRATMQTVDVQELLETVQRFCHARTRIILETYSPLWKSAVSMAQHYGVCHPEKHRHWLSTNDICNIVHLAGFEPVTHGSYLLMPVGIPVLSWIGNNLLAHMPGIHHLNLVQWMIIRPRRMVHREQDVRVSVVIPCRNERGNIQAAVERCPQLGNNMEIIFVEGNSRDDTYSEIERVAKLYPERAITVLKQDGKGKGDAVRKAFAHARGDMLIILDADLTMPPEELPKFFYAMLHGVGECINGSRLVYRMENNAMSRPAYLANWAISRLVSWALGQRVKDTLCGTKVLWKKDYECIAAQRHFFGFQDPYGDFDLLFGAAKLGLKIVDVPVHYKDRTYGTTNISRFKDVWFLWWMGIQALLRFTLRWF